MTGSEDARGAHAIAMRACVQVSEMLDAGRELFKDLAADFEERLCS